MVDETCAWLKMTNDRNDIDCGRKTIWPLQNDLQNIANNQIMRHNIQESMVSGHHHLADVALLPFHLSMFSENAIDFKTALSFDGIFRNSIISHVQQISIQFIVV